MMALADELDLTVSELVALFCVYRCAKCSTVYCDPWLSTTGMTRLYTNRHPQHLLGWQHFYQWAQKKGDGSQSTYEQRLWNLLNKVVGEIKTYAELGCPFMGLLLYLKGCELSGQNKTDYVAREISRLQASYLHPWNRRSVINIAARGFFRLRKAITKERFVADHVQYANVNQAAIWQIKNRISYPTYQDWGAHGKPSAPSDVWPALEETLPCLSILAVFLGNELCFDELLLPGTLQ